MRRRSDDHRSESLTSTIEAIDRNNIDRNNNSKEGQ